jgi:hypothetical protein
MEGWCGIVGAGLTVVGVVVGGRHTGVALKHAFTTSFGTLCVGSLVLAPANAVKLLLRDGIGDDSSYGGGLWRGAVWRRLQMESTVGIVNRFAVPMAAVFGHPFCHSAKMATLLLRRHDLEGVAADRSSAVVVRVGAAVFSLCSALGAGALCEGYIAWVQREGGPAAPQEGLVWAVAARLVFALSWTVSNLLLSFFAGTLLDAVDVMLLLYAIDRDHLRVSRNGEELHRLLSSMKVRTVGWGRGGGDGWLQEGKLEFGVGLDWAGDLMCALGCHAGPGDQGENGSGSGGRGMAPPLSARLPLTTRDPVFPLSLSQVGRPLMSARYTPRGWTYQGHLHNAQAVELLAEEEVERKQNLSKYEQARSSAAAQEWGMQRALDTLRDHENRSRHVLLHPRFVLSEEPSLLRCPSNGSWRNPSASMERGCGPAAQELEANRDFLRFACLSAACR